MTLLKDTMTLLKVWPIEADLQNLVDKIYGGHDPRDPISITIVDYSILPFVAVKVNNKYLQFKPISNNTSYSTTSIASTV
jgi:hypothetical protein